MTQQERMIERALEVAAALKLHATAETPPPASGRPVRVIIAKTPQTDDPGMVAAFVENRGVAVVESIDNGANVRVYVSCGGSQIEHPDANVKWKLNMRVSPTEARELSRFMVDGHELRLIAAPPYQLDCWELLRQDARTHADWAGNFDAGQRTHIALVGVCGPAPIMIEHLGDALALSAREFTTRISALWASIGELHRAFTLASEIGGAVGNPTF